ncbi:MAG: hypothetical protein RLZZ01_527 [Actinomycetota bacterium]|jgi:hypothetical protein
MPSGRQGAGGGGSDGCLFALDGGCGDASTPRAWWLRGVVLVGVRWLLSSGVGPKAQNPLRIQEVVWSSSTSSTAM